MLPQSKALIHRAKKNTAIFLPCHHLVQRGMKFHCKQQDYSGKWQIWKSLITNDPGGMTHFLKRGFALGI